MSIEINDKLEKIYRLEKILMEFGVKRPIKNDGTLSASGAIAYKKLLCIVDELHQMGAISEPSVSVKEYCDNIIQYF